MTQNEKLDAVLSAFRVRTDSGKSKWSNSRDVILSVAKDSTQPEVDELRTLLSDAGYIEGSPFSHSKEPHYITDKGKEFILAGGYKEQNAQKVLDHKIKTGTVESFKYGKWAFLISVISLIVAFIALFK